MENTFHVQPFGGSQHDPEDKITFLVHIPKIITKKEAINLAANILALLAPEEHQEIDGLLDGSRKPPSSKEFPKMLYDHKRTKGNPEGKEIVVKDAAEEKAARAAGAESKPLAKYDHGAAQRADDEAAESAVESATTRA